MGVERRRDWSDEKKLSILQEAAEPDAEIAQWHDIKPQQIYTWRLKFAAKRAERVVSSLPLAPIDTGTRDEAEQPAPTDKPTAKRAARPMRVEIWREVGSQVAWRDIVPIHLGPIGPLQGRVAGERAAIVADDHPRLASVLNDTV